MDLNRVFSELHCCNKTRYLKWFKGRYSLFFVFWANNRDAWSEDMFSFGIRVKDIRNTFQIVSNNLNDNSKLLDEFLLDLKSKRVSNYWNSSSYSPKDFFHDSWRISEVVSDILTMISWVFFILIYGFNLDNWVKLSWEFKSLKWKMIFHEIGKHSKHIIWHPWLTNSYASINSKFSIY